MTFRSIAVHLAPTIDGSARMKLALALAKDFDAALIGLGVVDTEENSTATTGLAEMILEQRRRDFELALETLQDHFLSAAAHVRASWRSALSPTVDYCATHARAADLIVAGRRSESDPSPGFRLEPASLLMRVGRPLLLVPPGVEQLSAERVVVAWKASREARLAVQLALPFLIRAKSVSVVGVGDEVDADELKDVANLLSSHNSAADWRQLPRTKSSVADDLIACATEEGADLIVSGGYRRGPVSEWILGGVTRDLLATSPICCLMAH